MIVNEVKFRGHRLFQDGRRLVLESEQGRRELPAGTRMSVTGDSVSLSNESQTLTFNIDGRGARLVDHEDPQEPTYRLQADGRFRFTLAGFQSVVQPGSEGTLISPTREVNPLIPLEVVLPDLKLSEQPTQRVSRARILAQGLGSFPLLPGLTAGLGAYLLYDFGTAALVGSAVTVGCLGLRAWGEKKETYSLLGAGPVVGGEFSNCVRRLGKPAPGSSRGATLTLDELNLRLVNGIRLKMDNRKVSVVSGQSEKQFKYHTLNLEKGNVGVSYLSDDPIFIKPDGSLEGQDEGDFAEHYSVVSQKTHNEDGQEVGFGEDEVHFDEFRLPYDHG